MLLSVHRNGNRPDLTTEFGGNLNANLRGHRHQLPTLIQRFQENHLNKTPDHQWEELLLVSYLRWDSSVHAQEFLQSIVAVLTIVA